MLFGSQQRFAIESELDQPTPEYLFGKICLWASGKQLGDYQQTVLLSPIADFFRKSLRFQGKRQEQIFDDKNAQEVLNIASSILSGNFADTKTDQESEKQWKRFSKFFICPNGCEAFDGELALLIENPDLERFIWQDFQSKSIYEIRLRSSEYATIVESFLNWINPLMNYNPISDHFSDNVFVFIGNFQKMTRGEIELLVRRLGGRVNQRISDETSFVVLGNIGSESNNKLLQAESLQIPILKEEEFFALLPSSLNHGG